MNKKEKAQKVLDEDLVFMASDRKDYSLFVCKGVSNRVYEILYRKALNKYICECKNVRTGPCYHIVAVHKLRTGKWL